MNLKTKGANNTSEPKRIYVVTSGCYSDYSIDAVFSTEDEAKKYVGPKKQDTHFYGKTIEVYFLDTANVKRNMIFIRLDKDRNVVDTNEWIETITEPCDLEVLEGLEKDGGFHTRILTDNMEKAIKVANERMSGYILKMDQKGKK